MKAANSFTWKYKYIHIQERETKLYFLPVWEEKKCVILCFLSLILFYPIPCPQIPPRTHLGEGLKDVEDTEFCRNCQECTQTWNLVVLKVLILGDQALVNMLYIKFQTKSSDMNLKSIRILLLFTREKRFKTQKDGDLVTQKKRVCTIKNCLNSVIDNCNWLRN